MERQKETEAFVAERRALQFAVFEHNFKQAKEIYERDKEQLSEEERDAIEVEIEKTEKQIADYHEKNPGNLLP